MDKQEASKQIATLLEEAHDKIRQAVRISEESGVMFETPWGGEGTSERGIGATYYPNGHPGIGDDDWTYRNEGWNSSNGTC